uniref:Uncharacterized protein n=1 Tax=Melopsittacus undulatus TaxID=13146 RepID=A0A8V5GA67_MELUD
MDVLNLSRVFGPTLVGHSSASPTPLAILEDVPRQCKVVARLLSLPPDFWTGFVGTEQENLVPVPASRGPFNSFFPFTAGAAKLRHGLDAALSLQEMEAR